MEHQLFLIFSRWTGAISSLYEHKRRLYKVDKRYYCVRALQQTCLPIMLADSPRAVHGLKWVRGLGLGNTDVDRHTTSEKFQAFIALYTLSNLVRKNEISLRKCSGGTAQLRTLEGTLHATRIDNLSRWMINAFVIFVMKQIYGRCVSFWFMVLARKVSSVISTFYHHILWFLVQPIPSHHWNKEVRSVNVYVKRNFQLLILQHLNGICFSFCAFLLLCI